MHKTIVKLCIGQNQPDREYGNTYIRSHAFHATIMNHVLKDYWMTLPNDYVI